MKQFLPVTSSFMILKYFDSEKYYKELCHLFNKVKSSIKVKYFWIVIVKDTIQRLV